MKQDKQRFRTIKLFKICPDCRSHIYTRKVNNSMRAYICDNCHNTLYYEIYNYYKYYARRTKNQA